MIYNQTPEENYKGLQSTNNANQSMFNKERGSLEIPSLSNSHFLTGINLNDVSMKSMRHLDRRSRQKKLNSIRKN